jgi:porin
VAPETTSLGLETRGKDSEDEDDEDEDDEDEDDEKDEDDEDEDDEDEDDEDESGEPGKRPLRRVGDVEDWLAGDYAAGLWGGLRTDLEQSGIEVFGNYVVDLQALAHGGSSRGGTWDYAGLMTLGIEMDLEKLAGVPGLSLLAEGAWASGEDLSSKVGGVFPPAQAFSGRSLRLARLYMQQSLLDEKLSLKIGRLTTADDFLASPIYGDYVSGAINDVPTSVPLSTPGFARSPFTQWGAVASYEPHEQIRAAIGVFSSDDEINKDKENGVDFSLNPSNGIMTIGELCVLWNQSTEDTGLPGTIRVGGWYDTGPRPSLRNDADNKGNNGGVYVGVDQMVFREGEAGGSEQGLTPWLVVTYEPRASVNQLPFFLGAGLGYQGLIPTRDDDRAAIGFYYGILSKDIQDASSEKVLEISYTAQLTPWVYIRPDAQFIFRPGGDGETSNAIVIGGEIGINF